MKRKSTRIQMIRYYDDLERNRKENILQNGLPEGIINNCW